MPDNPKLTLDHYHPSATPREALALKPKVIVSKAFIDKREESVVKKLYPDYVAPKIQQEDERERKNTIDSWYGSELYQDFVRKVMGSDQEARNLLPIMKGELWKNV